MAAEPFRDACNFTELFRNQKKNKRAKIVQSFSAPKSVEALRKNEKYKYAGRNVLGVRHIEDWINSLEIGHVMQLNPMTAQEFTQGITKYHEY